MHILDRVYTGNREAAYDDIISCYKQQGDALVSFLYFSNLMHGRLLEEPEEEWQERYRKALEASDFLLPDGIALQLFHRFSAPGREAGQMVANLNGTDFIPYFLDRLLLKTKDIHIGLFTVYDPKIGKPAAHLAEAKHAFAERFDHPISFSSQVLYSEREKKGFDLDGYLDAVKQADKKYSILLLCTGTPAQEIWAMEHLDELKEAGVLVFNAGGLIDYISGFEQRAPDRVVRARVLETPWRIIQHPHKNFKKFGRMFGIVRYWRKLLTGRL